MHFSLQSTFPSLFKILTSPKCSTYKTQLYTFTSEKKRRKELPLHNEILLASKCSMFRKKSKYDLVQ